MIEHEQTLMRGIGLGQHYNWFNGSGSCRSIRTAAAERLRSVLDSAHDAGLPVAKADGPLCTMLKRIAEGDGRRLDGFTSDSSLTDTWQSAANIIRVHLEASHLPNAAARLAAFREMEDYLGERYPYARRLERTPRLSDMRGIGKLAFDGTRAPSQYDAFGR